MITLPAQPWNVDDEWTNPENGVVYKYDDKGRWVIIYAASMQWVPRTGSTMLGPLISADDPAQPLEFANKQYVDNTVGPTSMWWRHIVAQQGYLSWDFELQDQLGNPNPEDPAKPGQIVYTNQDATNQGVKVIYVYSGDITLSMQIFYTEDGGTNWLPAGNTTDPNAKLTFTYSTRPGFENSVISGAWS